MGLLSLLLLLPLLRRGSLQELPGYKLDVQRSVSAQEGLCIFVPCAFSVGWGTRSSYSMYLYWFREGDKYQRDAPVATTDPSRAVKPETRSRFRLLGDPKARNCSLAVSPVRKADEGTYYLRVEQGGEKYNFIYTKLTLNISALTEKPDILFGGPLRSGRPEVLNCSLKTDCKGDSPLAFLWVGDAVAPLGPESLRSSRLTLTPRPRDHSTSLTCLVTLPGAGVSMARTVRLNVTYPPQKVTASISQGNGSAFRTLGNISSLTVLEGQVLRIVCEADSNPPANLSWFRGSPGLNATPITSSATLELLAVGTPDAGELSCLAQHPLGSQEASLFLAVQRTPGCQAGLIPGALMGAGAMAVLSLCLCLLFYSLTKAWRHRGAGRRAALDDEDAVMDTVARGSRHKSQPDSPADSTGDTAASGEPQEIYYASLSFQGVQARELQEVAASGTTEYSEIRARK